jgi:hypothetical protein
VLSGRACRGDGVHGGVDVVAMSFSRGIGDVGVYGKPGSSKGKDEI